MPFFLNSAQISVRNPLFSNVFHPALEVMASAASGTRVTCAGTTSSTRSTNAGMGLPSILSSVVSTGFNALTSEYLICLSSGLGCTVMPSAPKRSQSKAALITSGMFPPREFRNVAILFIFTLSLVIVVSIARIRQK